MGDNSNIQTSTSPVTQDDVETPHRVDVYRRAPHVHEAIKALSKAVKVGLDPTLVTLVETRASQINHCAWCLRLHTRRAREEGISNDQLDLLAAWEETDGLFSERERAALALTEAGTLLTDGFVPDDVYARAAAVFTEDEQAQLIAVIARINAVNRISVMSRRAPRYRK